MNIYELSAAQQQIQSMIEDGVEGLEETLESLNEALEEKAVGYAKIIRNLEGQAAAIKTEEDRLSTRRRYLESNVKRLKEALEQAMIQTGTKKIKTELFSFNIQKNPSSVEVLNQAFIPEKYLIPQQPSVDKKAILADLKNGEEIPGVQLKQSESLRIK